MSTSSNSVSLNVLQPGMQSVAGLDLATCYSNAFKLYARQNELIELETIVQGTEARSSAKSMQQAGKDDFDFYTAQGASQIGEGSVGLLGTVAGQTAERLGAKEAAPLNAKAEEAGKYESHANKLLLEGNLKAKPVATETAQDQQALEANQKARLKVIQNENGVLGDKFDGGQLDNTMYRDEAESLRTTAGRARKDWIREADGIRGRASQNARFYADLGQAFTRGASATGALVSATAKEKAANDNAFAELNRGASQQAESANRATEANQQAALELTKSVISTQAAIANAQRA